MELPSRISRRRFLATASVATVGGMAGCGATAEPSPLEGQIRMDGSNTVFPHGAALAEEFLWRNAGVQIPASGSGTGAGFQRFCRGEIEFQNASRAILPDEVDQCGDNGVDYLELPALLDGIAIMKHPDNDWCDCLTVEELSAIWERNSTVDTWADVRDEWPDEPIDLYGRDSASGTFDYFTNAVNGEYGNIRDDYSATPDTNVIVSGVSGNRNALGFGGAGYYYENEEDLALIAIDDGTGCTVPTPETIEEGTYQPLSREMYLYVNANELYREEVAAFASFYFEPIDETGRELGVEQGFIDPDEELSWTQWAARRVGFYAIPNEIVEESQAALERAVSEAQL